MILYILEKIVQAQRQELITHIARAIPSDGKVEPLTGLQLHRSSVSMESVHGVSDISFCVIAQGSKELFLGSHRYQYDPSNYLLVTAELPVVGQILAATREHPYLSLRLHLDPALIGSIMVEIDAHPAHVQADLGAMSVGPLDSNLLDAVVRLVRLLDTPTEAQFIAPLITREIVYRLLLSKQGDRLRHLATLGSHTNRIANAVERLRKDFDQPIRIAAIAHEYSMSVASFHHYFKAFTAMSPLQFQKRVRLQEARRLMLSENLDVAGIAHRVGYYDASHFNREYKRFFGLPPMRDIQRLRESSSKNLD